MLETTAIGKTGTLRDRQRVQREDSILDAALEMIGDRGYAAMTMEELAERVGISKPTLYQHFASKEEIAVRAVVWMVRRARDFMEAQDPSLPGMVRMENSLRWVLCEKYLGGKARLGAARDALGPAIRAHAEYQAEYRQLVDLLMAMFEAGQNEGDLNRELSPRIAVQMVFSTMRDTEYTELIDNQECRPEAVVETLLTVLMNGWKAKDTAK